MPEQAASRDGFIRAAVAPRNTSHASGVLLEANAMLARDPSLATRDIHIAAILGDDAAVRAFLTTDPTLATATSAPYDWDALTHLCFSRYLRLDDARSEGFVNAARAALHVASWRARHDVVRLLIARGADVNARNAANQSPLMLAAKANVDSYWTDQASTESIEALLTAGASVSGARFPSGYEPADALLRAHGAT